MNNQQQKEIEATVKWLQRVGGKLKEAQWTCKTLIEELAEIECSADFLLHLLTKDN